MVFVWGHKTIRAYALLQKIKIEFMQPFKIFQKKCLLSIAEINLNSVHDIYLIQCHAECQEISIFTAVMKGENSN